MTHVYEQAPPGTATIVLQRLVALPVLLCAVTAAITFPVIPYLLLAGIVGYALLLWWRPEAWLVALPLLLPLVELAPWSGRLLFDAFDMFAVTTVAAALWHCSFRLQNFRYTSRGVTPVLTLLTVAWVVSFIHGAWPLGSLDGNALSGYYTHYNSFRVFKGFLWALLLAPPMGQALREDTARTRRLLWTGLAASLLAVGLVVLWERGVIGDLLQWRDRYLILGDLLDFTTTYRVTALFSEMHTGGAQIDGFLALVWPFALLPVFSSRQWYVKACGALALGLGLYAMSVTFSRDVYAAFATSSTVILLGLTLSHRRRLSPLSLGWLVPALGVMMAIAAYEHKHGGTVALASVMLAFVLAAGLFAEARRLPMATRLTIGAAAGLLSYFGVAYGMTTSKWVQNSATEAALTALVTVTCSGIAGIALGVTLRGLQRFNTWLLVVLVGAILAAGVSVLGGYRMEERFSTVSQDAETRLSHWRDVLAAMSPDWTAKLIGMGLGRFPYDFLIYTGDDDHVGSYAYHSEPGGQSYLRLGGGKDTQVGQRIPLQANTHYHIAVRVRAMDPKARLNIAICEKNILFQQLYQPNCRYPRVKLSTTVGQWQQAATEVDTDRIGRGAWYSRWPTVLLLQNPTAGTVLDVDNIAMLNPQKHNLLANGDFHDGGDRWFSYNDYAHLQWHTKNLWMNVYFEQGILGVLSLFACIILALDKGIQRIRCGDTYALVATAGVCGFLTVGMFGSLFDAPRLTLVFMLLLWSLILDPQANPMPAKAARRHSASRHVARDTPHIDATSSTRALDSKEGND